MAAIAGSWKAQNVGSQILPEQWGTGYNPIHAVRTGEGRNTAPGGNDQIIDQSLTLGDFSGHGDPDYGYASEDAASVLWGYGTETGTADRQPWDDNHDMESGDTSIPSTHTPYPAYGHYPQGVPGGTAIRAEDHGADANYTAKAQQYESGAGGWINKETSEVNNAGISDPDQYVMQTSMVQRDKVRAGSQAASGRANEYDAPIASRIPGMIEKKWSDDSHRRYDMTPREQDMIVRPWYMRTAGTGRAYDMRVNESQLNSPLNRRPPDNPNAGVTVGAEDYSSDYGYTSEDKGWGY